jgi:ethanolamine utilization protein EutA (predicted chaperonin)
LARNPPHDGRIELAHIWMTEVGLLRWVQQQDEYVRESESANPVFYIEIVQKAQAIVAHAKSLGMDFASPVR